MMGKNHEIKNFFFIFWPFHFVPDLINHLRNLNPDPSPPPPKKKKHFSQYTFSVRIAKGLNSCCFL